MRVKLLIVQSFSRRSLLPLATFRLTCNCQITSTTLPYLQAALAALLLCAVGSGTAQAASTAEELTSGLHSALDGGCSLSPEVASRVIEGLTGSGSQVRLTTRENEVLRLVAEGLSSKAIAAELQISPRTAETHRANVMSKLGFHGVADLVRFAIREGFVTP